MVNDSYLNKSKADSIMELDQQVSQLIDRYEKLEKENELLYSEQAKLTSQVASLTETNDQVRMKIESLLAKLKMLGGENTGGGTAAMPENLAENAPENPLSSPNEEMLEQESFADEGTGEQHG